MIYLGNAGLIRRCLKRDITFVREFEISSLHELIEHNTSQYQEFIKAYD